MRESFLQTVAAPRTHQDAHRREAVLLPSLQQGFCGQVQSQGSPTDPFGCEKIPMQELLQNLLQDVSSAQAWGIWLLCSTLNWDTFPPPEKEKKNSVASLFFQENCQGITSKGVCSQTCRLFFSLRAVHFISEWEIAHVLLVWSSVSVTAVGVELCHAMYSPTCAIHALFCMSRMFCMPSKCYLQCFVPVSVNGCYAVLHFFFIRTTQTIPKGALWMTVYM